MTTELSVNDKNIIKSLKNYADGGNSKKYIDNLNKIIYYHNLDLPTITDSNSSIIDKHAIIDIYNNNPSPKITKFYNQLGKHPDVEYWYDDGHNFIPLSGTIMKRLICDTINYIKSHYDSADTERNPNIHDSIGGLKDEI